MPKRKEKRKHEVEKDDVAATASKKTSTTEEAAAAFWQAPLPEPDSDLTEAESELSEPEDFFIQGKDVLLDRESDHDDPDDPEWEPLAKFYVEEDQPEHSAQPSPQQEQHSSQTQPLESGPPPRRSGRSRGRGRSRGGSHSEPSPGDGRRQDTDTRTVLDLFQLFFTNTILLTLIANTNVHGRTTCSSWTDITLEDMFCFLSVVIYMGITKVPELPDYWRKGRLYSFPFPKSVIAGQKYLAIIRALRLSSADDDAQNERARGTDAFDRLGKIQPLYSQIRTACKQNYQPAQHMAKDKRMVASKARTIFKQYLKSKPVRWGFTLFVLADSETGYTWDFFVDEGKNTETSVVSLLNTNLLGTGFKLYADNFCTSPALFRDLSDKNTSACGTIRTRNREGCPKTTNDAPNSNSEDPQLFVQGKDTRDVSTHTAHEQETVQRRVKNEADRWTPAIKDCNKHTGGVDRTDYGGPHKTKKWHKAFFYHFVDIAVVNSFILHKEQCKRKGKEPMRQKKFRETLILELADAGSTQAPQREDRGEHHRPVYISSSGDKTQGRLRCRKCQLKTPIKCSGCNMPLCFLPLRDCYNEWHIEHNL